MVVTSQGCMQTGKINSGSATSIAAWTLCYKRLLTVLDQPSGAREPGMASQTPSFFSGNVEDLGNALSRLQSALLQSKMATGCHRAFQQACGGYTDAGFNGEDHYVSVKCEGCKNEGRVRQGHGWGLCQRGAIAMARTGFSWRATLDKYFPSRTVVRKFPG